MIDNIYAYYYISSASTNQIITGACTLGRIIIPNTLVGTIKVIDNTAGSTANVATFGIGTTPSTYIFEVTCGTGLRVITSSSSDLITITFKTH